MSISHGNYKSCLGTAAEVDRNEQAYALVHSTPDSKQVAMTACVSSPHTWSAFIEIMVAQFGAYIESKLPESLSMPPNGMTTHERQLCIGATSWLVAMMKEMNDETSNTLQAMVANALLITNQKKEQEQQAQ